jgi:hypothetical protein
VRLSRKARDEHQRRPSRALYSALCPFLHCMGKDSAAMALVLSRSGAAPVQNPRKPLEDAILEFQSILDDKEKVRLKNLSQKPDANAVLTFTASLDRMNPNHRGRSIATRLYSFLQCIQQFTSTVDVFVQANPAIAALVWGSVRFTMTVGLLMLHPRIVACC